MIKTDVCIIGAGPAGSTAAKILSEKGFDVILVDKDKFPRDKPCGGGLPVSVLKRFKYLDSKQFIESYTYTGTAYSPSLKYKADIKRDTPILATTLRKNFDNELVKLAIDTGTNFIDGKSVIDIRIDEDKATVILKDDTKIDAKIVVGADGVWSFVAKKLGFRGKEYKTTKCVLQEFEVDEKVLDEYFTKSRHCHVHSRFENILGYGWVFPKNNHLNIGVGSFGQVDTGLDEKMNLLDCYKSYLQFLQNNNIIPKNLKDTKIKGGAIPIYPFEKTYGDRVILIGDAGGFVNSISGEGLYYAMASGEDAAIVIAEALDVGRFDEGFLSKFQKLWKKDFGKDLRLYYTMIKKQRKRDGELVFKIADKDELLSELIIGIITGEISINRYKWKIIRRYLFVLIKNRFI